MNIRARISATIFVLLLVFARSESFAGGFAVPFQSARSLGLGNAQTAGVNEASAVYHNPAALSDVEGNNLLLTGSYINVVNSVENSGRTASNKHDDNFLATLFGNYHLPGTDFTLGLGAYTPFGLATTYENDFTRFASERTELKTIYVTPALSWNPSKYFAIGGGLSYVHASGLFSRGLCLDPVSGCTSPLGFEGRMRLTDTTNAFAYNLGVLVKPLDNWKVGISYRSRVDLRFDKAEVKLGTLFTPGRTKAKVSPIALPPVINAGLFWQITPSWAAEFVYEHTRWSEFKNFKASFAPTPTFGPLGGLPIPGFTLPENWKNTSTLRLGSSYALNKNWEIRSGIIVEQTPIPSRTLNPAIPGADLLSLNGGVGYKWQSFSIDLGYMAVFYKTRKVINNELEGLPATGPLGFAGAPGKDKYETFNNFVSFSVGYKF